jgi:hypothetical protein
MNALAAAPSLTLDELLAEVLDGLDAGSPCACLVCGERADPDRDATGVASLTCRGCGSVLEDARFAPGPWCSR